ncbi:MAG TPA: enoyl-CoA hydratase-related protein [Longimicrobiales bacterium]|nr:enoyl-CoA hydratase-related protein [Longimicrobiales bacterium]
MMTYEFIKLEKRGAIAVVTINRPDKLNALNAVTVGEVRRAFEEIREDKALHGAIMTGEGQKAFIAGADIAELSQMTPLSGTQVSRAGQDTLRIIETMPIPVIAAINGFALGGGLEFALACHMRIASENAKLGLPEVKLGIIPGYGGTIRLPRLVGRGRALEIMLSGEMIDAQEAYRIGLVNRVVAQAELISTAEALLNKIAANGPVAVALAIQAVDNSYHSTTEDAQRLEANMFGLLASTTDMREGMAAFLEKRAAEFTGA